MISDLSTNAPCEYGIASWVSQNRPPCFISLFHTFWSFWSFRKCLYIGNDFLFGKHFRKPVSKLPTFRCRSAKLILSDGLPTSYRHPVPSLINYLCQFYSSIVRSKPTDIWLVQLLEVLGALYLSGMLPDYSWPPLSLSDSMKIYTYNTWFILPR